MPFTTKGGFDVAFREARAEDEAFIFNSWLMSHRENGDWPKRVSKNRYFAEQKLTITKLLAKSRTIVACNADRTWQVFGFIVFESTGVLHWVFVKQTYRREGIAARLGLEAAKNFMRLHESSCSHWTPAAEMLRQHGWHLRFDPFLVENLP